MLALAGIDADPAAALADGRALERYRAMIAAQGGDPDAALPSRAHTEVLRAESAGWLSALDARAVGRRRLAPRRRPGPEGRPGVGRPPGSSAWPSRAIRSRPGSRCSNCAATTPAGSTARSQALAGALEIGPQPPEPAALIIERIG